MRRPVVFLDRDGTVNEEVGYLNHLSRLRLLPGAAEGIRRLKEAGFAVVIVTNQSGPARGYFPETLVHEVNRELLRRLAARGARVDGVYVCLHHPEAGCACRKPETGLARQAAEELNLDLSRAYVVGDRWVDLALARRLGACGVLVLTGYGRGELEYVLPGKGIEPDLVARDLREAAELILSRERESGRWSR
ncbi:HAD-IIIA family hydrolase [Thermosulfurimonas sp. F29]|uniref:D-glycero-alpha-D-manno-heptose-1,7-bisphosphate 7-phosphatase n=1 Tax=Thermosulfurimonas sp. F29 TaxID=2867247 RepID=UPI001C836BFD|nr:HAD family hydrolase [Thermosulfurimonas sp. F29]MBX6422608.1 HAD family hydrolase [Thermosulfurimonas sp. F29]